MTRFSARAFIYFNLVPQRGERLSETVLIRDRAFYIRGRALIRDRALIRYRALIRDRRLFETESRISALFRRSTGRLSGWYRALIRDRAFIRRRALIRDRAHIRDRLLIRDCALIQNRALIKVLIWLRAFNPSLNLVKFNKTHLKGVGGGVVALVTTSQGYLNLKLDTSVQ